MGTGFLLNICTVDTSHHFCYRNFLSKVLPIHEYPIVFMLCQLNISKAIFYYNTVASSSRAHFLFLHLPDITYTLAPSAPTIVSVEATSSTSISIQWNASQEDRGSPVTGYIVEYRPTSSPASAFETSFVEEDILSTTLDGLTPSTEYEMRVRGENAVDRSVPSVTMRTKTKADSELSLNQ